jgi:hypothetical protein
MDFWPTRKEKARTGGMEEAAEASLTWLQSQRAHLKEACRLGVEKDRSVGGYR